MEIQLFVQIVMVIIGIISLFYGISYVTLSFFDIMKMDKVTVRTAGAVLIGVSIALFIVYAMLFK